MALLDTSFLIDILRGNEEARVVLTHLEEQQRRQHVSAITAAELWVGAAHFRGNEREETEKLLDSMVVIPFNQSIARRTGRLQSSNLDEGARMSFNDCAIAATAIEHSFELVTADNDFSSLPNLSVRTYDS